MSKIERKNLGRADEVISFDHGRAEQVIVGEQTVGRTTLDPGWQWSTHMRPIVGTEWCESRHVGVMLSGVLHIRLPDGTDMEFEPGDVYVIPAGHDGWVVGDEPAIAIEWAGLRGWAEGESLSERVLATVLFTDIVDSTAIAARLGDTRWHDVLARFNNDVRDLLATHRGREIKTTGDGFLATFTGAARAVRCGAYMTARAATHDLQIRVAVHTGEVEYIDGDARGMTVHEAARVLSLAGPDEVLVTGFTRDMAAGAGFAFEDRGEHQLKGIEGPKRIFRLVRPPG